MRTQRRRMGRTDGQVTPAGEVGETIPFGRLAAAALSLTNNVAATVFSQVLGPGRWLVFACCCFNPTSATTTVGYRWFSLSETDNTQAGADEIPSYGGDSQAGNDPGNAIGSFFPAVREIQVAAGATKTVYGVARSSFDQTMTAWGSGFALRIG